jgi:two-component system, NarL family, response regulator NreC
MMAPAITSCRKEVAGGTIYLDPAVAATVAAERARPAAPPAEELSAREREVVRLIALGYANKEIAARLRLSVKTVETYKTRSLEKLGMRSRVDIVRYVVRRGWLSDPDEAGPKPRERVSHES